MVGFFSDNSNPDSTADEIASLLRHPHLWRADQLIQAPDTLPSGFANLDEHLPGGGWPRAGLSEFLLPTTGIGELRLLAPALKALSEQEERWLAWINPPFIPYAPALNALGIDISKILLVHPKNHQDALWALERATRSGTCSMVLAWLDEKQLKVKDTQRLQLAAKQGHTFTCLFRPKTAALLHSMAELRLEMALVNSEVNSEAKPGAKPGVEPGILEVSINKRRGGWPVTGLRVQVAESRRPEELPEQLSLWRHLRAGASASSPSSVKKKEELPQETPNGLPRSVTTETDSRVAR